MNLNQTHTKRTFRGLSTLILVHDVETSAEQPVQERALARERKRLEDRLVSEFRFNLCRIERSQLTLAGRLRSKHGDDVVLETLVQQVPFFHMLSEILAVSSWRSHSVSSLLLSSVRFQISSSVRKVLILIDYR